VVGLDGRGGAALYGSVGQWLSAYERATAEESMLPGKPSAPAAPRPVPAAKPRKLSYREQQEWEEMEATITAAEQAVADRQAEVERAVAAGHAILSEACRALEEAQRAVERLYGRWQELEAKRES
jgi:ATP-binding cassette subfamily F protein uup